VDCKKLKELLNVVAFCQIVRGGRRLELHHVLAAQLARDLITMRSKGNGIVQPPLLQVAQVVRTLAQPALLRLAGHLVAAPNHRPRQQVHELVKAVQWNNPHDRTAVLPSRGPLCRSMSPPQAVPRHRHQQIVMPGLQQRMMRLAIAAMVMNESLSQLPDLQDNMGLAAVTTVVKAVATTQLVVTSRGL
jgi:hypothetical protein